MWRYGNSWEQYPIKPGEIWQEARSGSLVAVHDLFDGLPEFMIQADLIYTDPPWNTGNIRGFYTKAGLKTTRMFVEFADALFIHVGEIAAPVCYLEIGKQNLDLFKEKMSGLYSCVQAWPVTYYRKNRSFLLRGGWERTTFNFTDKDDMETPRLAMEQEVFSCVADLCMGRGLTATTAFLLGKRFVGTELHPRRLAVAIERVAKVEGRWHIIQP